MADSFLSGFIEVFQQLDKPPTCGSHGPRSLSSYVAKQQEAGRARKNRRCWPFVAKQHNCMQFVLITYRVCRPPGRSRQSPIQRRRSQGLFGHCSARRSLTTWAQIPGVKFCSGDPRVFTHCVVDISKGLDGVPLTTEVFTDPVETLSPFSRPFCLRGLQLFDCLVVTLALFVEFRASQHGEQVVRPRERRGVHHGATNQHCYARHYLRISAGMSPCLISMSLVAMARATSTTTMPTSRSLKSSFEGLPSIASLPSRAYPAASQRLLRSGIAR